MSSPASQNGAPPTAWPGTAATSIGDLLTGLRQHGQTEKAAVGTLRTPFSLQVIQSSATWLSKGWAALLALTGGSASLIALITGVWWGIGSSEVRIAVVASAAAVLSAVFVAIAVIVRADVTARATGAAARHQAEGEIVSAALDNYTNYWWPGYFVQKIDGTFLPVKSFNVCKDPGGTLTWKITTRTDDVLVDREISAVVAADDLFGRGR
jgi:hypothetical protein